jgi:hypothetical protein
MTGGSRLEGCLGELESLAQPTALREDVGRAQCGSNEESAVRMPRIKAGRRATG